MIQGTKGADSKHEKGYPSEELYKILFEQAADGIFISDASGRFIEVNPRGCEMLGYSLEEILHLSIRDVIAPQELEQVPLKMDELRAGKTITVERTVRHKDGVDLPVEVRAHLLSGDLILGLLRDISKRKQIEAELFQLARFPAENPNPVMRVSKQGEILYANEASRELLEEWNTKVGEMLPSAWKKTTSRLADKKSGQSAEVPCKGRIYSMNITPVRGADYVNLYGSDITEIRRSGEALRRAEEKYRNIFEHSQDGIFQSTPAGRFITVNPALAHIWGYESPEEVIESITNIAHQIYVNPEQRAEFLRVMNENEEVEDFEFQAYRKDGSVIWVQENVRTVRNADGSVQYYEGTVKDITDQKRTLEALRRSEERYRSTLNNMMEGCQIIDFDWRYIYVNDTAAQHGRNKPEVMLMRTMLELHPGIEKTDLFRILERCMTERIEQRIENEFAFPDGEKGWFDLSIQPVPEGLFILSIDITERKQAEIDLRDREARYRTLFENLPIPIFTKDREGCYTSFNAEESKYWAKSPVGYTDHELLPPDIADALRKDDLQVMETEEPWTGEEKFQTPSGLTYSFIRKVPLFDGEGKVVGVLGAGVDITQRKQAEILQEAVYQIAQITQVSETLEELISQIHKVISNIMPARNFYIALYNEQNKLLSFPYSVDEVDPPISGAIPLKKGLTEYVLRTGEPLLCNQEFQDELEKKGEVEQVGASSPVWLGVPLKVDGHTIGVMAVQHYSDPLAYGEREQRILEFVSSQVATALYRTQAEEALRISEERFRSLYENAAIGIYRTTPDGQILMVNPAAIRMLGYENFDDMLQRNLEQEGYEPTYPRKKFHERMKKEGIITGLESAWVRKDGSTIYVRESARAIRAEGGNIKYYDGTFEDITEQKLAEEQLRASEERYRDLVENSQELICTHDLDGNILSVNPWASKTLGYTPEEILQKNISDFLLPENRSVFPKYLAAIQKNGRAQGLLTVQTRSGEQLIWEYNNSLRTEGVEEPIVRGMAHDVTQQRRAEKKIKMQLARLTALREIDQYITSSFDLNQTLHMLVKEVSRQLDVHAATILLANSGTNMLEYAAGTGFLGNENREARVRIGEDYSGKVASERKMIHLPDLAQADPPISQTHLANDEKFVSYLGLPLLAKGQTKGVLEIFHRSPIEPDEEWLDYLETLAGQAAIAIDNMQLFNNLQRSNTELTLAYDATIEGWSYALDLRDKETEGHTQRVTEITYKLCEKFGLTEKELTYARWGALLHDIGKMGIPDSILLKPGKLTDEEWVIMKMHPTFARKMLERVNYLKSAINIPYYHHEKWDGSGYPEGLKGEQIPLTARIFAVADVWDALTSDRPYRPAWSKKDTLAYIKTSAGTHLDPQVVELFVASDDLWNGSDK